MVHDIAFQLFNIKLILTVQLQITSHSLPANCFMLDCTIKNINFPQIQLFYFMIMIE